MAEERLMTAAEREDFVENCMRHVDKIVSVVRQLEVPEAREKFIDAIVAELRAELAADPRMAGHDLDAISRRTAVVLRQRVAEIELPCAGSA